MLRLRRFTSALYTTALVSQVGVGLVIIVVGGIQRADLNYIGTKQILPVGLANYATGLQQTAWITLPLLVVLSGILGLLRKHLGSPWLWDTVHHHLDVIRKAAFDIQPGDGGHYHRATLFKFQQWRWCWKKWPWDGYLVPVERSGHTTRSGVSVFRAPDQADQCEGIAGRAWANNQLVTVSGLPALSNAAPQEDFEIYSRNTGVSIEWLRQRLPQARSLCGVPIDVKGRPWGVLVLDSRSPTGLKPEGAVMYEPTSRLLAKILERF